MATKEVVKQESQVPELYRPPAMDIDPEDIALPKLKIAQDTSFQTKQQLVKRGTIMTTLNKEDTDPVVLWEPNKKGDNPGVIVHVLGMFKGKSLSEGGELEMWAFNDPSAPPEAWTTYNYTVAIPEHDTEVPVRWLLTKSGKPSAQLMNMVIKKEEGRTPAYAIAFELKSDERNNSKGDFFVPVVKRVEADEDHVKCAERLAILVSGSAFDEPTSSANEPAI